MNTSAGQVSSTTRRRWISSIVNYIDEYLKEDLESLEIQIVGQWVFLEGEVSEPSSKDKLWNYLRDSKDFELARFEVGVQSVETNPGDVRNGGDPVRRR